MALSIRLARGGRKHSPFYRIVVADKRMPRDGRYIEKLGTYNPLLNDDNENRVQLVEDRITYWLSQGAQPSERVARFLGKAGLAPMPEQSNRPNKSKPGEKATLRVADKEEKVKAAAEAAAEAAAAPAPEPEPEVEVAPEAPAAEEAPAEAPAEEAKAEEAKEEAKTDDSAEKAE